jgi:hypothetical protein
MKSGFLLALLALSSTLAATAAPANAVAPASSQAKTPRPATADQEYKFERLKAPVTLPNLPNYPGRATFITGLRYPYAKAGQRVGLTYGTLEQAPQILEWYRETLKNYQWKIGKAETDNAVLASLNGNVVTVSVTPSTTPNYRSQLEISYTFVR